MDNSSALTRDFDSKWAVIEKEFKVQKEKGLFPFQYNSSTEGEQTITEEVFENTLKTLHDEKFTIAVCGVVKAGKSTFLNSLLFGNDILPAFDTPMTAKLTFIEYADKSDYATISFYTKDEWKKLKDDLQTKYPTQKQQLEERMSLCFSKYGVAEQNCINAPDKVLKNLAEIEEYVTDPKTKGGKYTPYVKNVHIYIKNESIKNLRIVDTPGLNDPNIINSLETEKWIRNTHALIFLLQPKGMNESDLNFFDVHLSNTSANNRIFVINKIDDLDDGEWEKTRAYLKKLGQGEEFIRRGHLFGEKETICGYSALLCMLKNMSAKGYPLNEDQEWALDGKEDYNADPNNVEAKISEKLYSNTGSKRIASGVNQILMVYSHHIKQLEKSIIESKNILADSQKSSEELEKELKELTDFGKKLTNSIVSYKEQVNDNVGQILAEELVRSAEKALDRMSNKILSEIQICKKAEGFRNLVYTFNEECEKNFGPFGTFQVALKNTKRKIREELEQTSFLVNRSFAQKEVDAKIDCSVLADFKFDDFDFDSISEGIKYELMESLPGNWFTELFTSANSMREETKGKFLKAKGDILQQLKNRTLAIRGDVIKQVETNFQDLNSQVQQICHGKKKIVETSRDNRSKIQAEAQNKLDSATARQNEIIELRRVFELHLPQDIRNSLE